MQAIVNIYLNEIRTSGLFSSNEFKQSNEYIFGGLSFFLGSLVLVKIYPENIKNDLLISRALDFTLIYLYLDHYLDSSNVKLEDKCQMISELKTIMNGESSSKHQLIAERYQKLITPELQPIVVDLFQTVVESFQIQYQTNSTCLETYLDITKRKGALTILAMYMLVNRKVLSSDDNTYLSLKKLGECIQILDDIIDASDDLSSGIMTAATYLIKKEKKLDMLALYLLREITLLPSKMEMLKFTMRSCVYYVMLRSRHFSLNLKRKCLQKLNKNRCKYIRFPSFRRRLEKEFRSYVLS